jgi:hypothetical protein
MEKLAIQVIADDYASHGMGVFPALPRSKEPAGSWKAFQWTAPSDAQRDALFSINCSLNIGAICGAASSNLISLDCETPRAFAETLRRVERAGYSETWTVQSQRGGHVHLLLPVTVKSIGKVNDVEVRAQGKFVLLPPSQHPEGPFYEFITQPPEIARVESLRELDWLQLETISKSRHPKLPRKAVQLLSGISCDRYPTRSEAEQALVTVLVNAAFTFDQILFLFLKYPAAGKFSDLQRHEGEERALDWLRHCFNKARDFCVHESPKREFAREMLAQALNTPWPGRTGSTDKAVFCAHATLAYRSGHETYHASSRDLAEISGCQRVTVSTATGRLRQKGYLQLTAKANFLYANRYRLAHFDWKVSENDPLTTHQCEGVAQTSSFLLPDAFRSGGLGKAAYEVITALAKGSSIVPDLARTTGRHPQTVRKALKRMLPLRLVEQRGRTWHRDANTDFEAIATALGVDGALRRQKEKHQRERIRRNVSQSIIRHRKDLGIM